MSHQQNNPDENNSPANLDSSNSLSSIEKITSQHQIDVLEQQLLHYKQQYETNQGTIQDLIQKLDTQKTKLHDIMGIQSDYMKQEQQLQQKLMKQIQANDQLEQQLHDIKISTIQQQTPDINSQYVEEIQKLKEKVTKLVNYIAQIQNCNTTEINLDKAQTVDIDEQKEQKFQQTIDNMVTQHQQEVQDIQKINDKLNQQYTSLSKQFQILENKYQQFKQNNAQKEQLNGKEYITCRGEEEEEEEEQDQLKKQEFVDKVKQIITCLKQRITELENLNQEQLQKIYTIQQDKDQLESNIKENTKIQKEQQKIIKQYEKQFSNQQDTSMLSNSSHSTNHSELKSQCSILNRSVHDELQKQKIQYRQIVEQNRIKLTKTQQKGKYCLIFKAVVASYLFLIIIIYFLMKK